MGTYKKESKRVPGAEDGKFSHMKHSPCEGGSLIEGTDIPLTVEPGATLVSPLGRMSSTVK